MSKAVVNVIKYIEAHGFVMDRQKNHYIFKLMGHTISMSKTPNNENTLIYDVRRDIRRAGIEALPLKNFN